MSDIKEKMMLAIYENVEFPMYSDVDFKEESRKLVKAVINAAWTTLDEDDPSTYPSGQYTPEGHQWLVRSKPVFGSHGPLNLVCWDDTYPERCNLVWHNAIEYANAAHFLKGEVE